MGALTLLALFASATTEYNLPPKLLDALCFVESNHRPHVINRDDGKGDSVGICQVQLRTARYMGYRGTEKGLLGPGTNILYAAKYLRYQLDRYGDLEKAIAAYNAGSYRVKAGKPVNQKYVDKVMKAYRQERALESQP